MEVYQQSQSAPLYQSTAVKPCIIAAVETDLEIEIFYRNTKGIFLTPQGEDIVKKFEQIISIYDSIKAQEEKPDSITGRLDILTEINIWTSYARFYKDFAKTYPNVQCFIKNMAKRLCKPCCNKTVSALSPE